MNQLLNYSEFIHESSFIDRELEYTQGDTNLFFQNAEKDTCPFCKISIEVIHKDSQSIYPEWCDGGRYDAQDIVKQCKQCGWWKLVCHKETTGMVDGKSIEITNSVLKKYDLSDKKIPIEILQKHLGKTYEDVIHINDKSMEKLVQSVFSEHYNCEVEHIGKSHDGGIDLLLINSDTPTVVQVKRRKKLAYTESVAGIREFIGATILKQSRNCIYVSTCEKFSQPSKKSAKKSIEVGAIDSYELYDFKRFQDILKLTSIVKEQPWEKCLRNSW